MNKNYNQIKVKGFCLRSVALKFVGLRLQIFNKHTKGEANDF